MFTRLGSSHHRIYFISGSEYHSYLSVGRQSGFERNLTEAHLMACLYAGLKMYGMNRECYAALVGKTLREHLRIHQIFIVDLNKSYSLHNYQEFSRKSYVLAIY